MKKELISLSCMAMFLVLSAGFVQAGDFGVRAEVTFAPLGRSSSFPPLGRRQGWLTITNRDWQAYSVVFDRGDRIFLYRANSGMGGMVIPSGTSVTVALERDTYDVFGDTGNRLRVRVREGRTTTLSLEPFGFVGNTGLVGVSNDGDRVRRETLFYARSNTIVIPAPPVIVNRPPPPPIIVRPPAFRPPPPRMRYHPGPGRRPPPPRRDGWGFGVHFGGW